MRVLVGSLLVLGIWCSCAEATISISEGLTRDFHLRPGEQQEGIIEVRSSSDEPVRVRLYQTDYRFFADGSNHYDEPGTGDRSNAGWIAFSPRETVIEPRGTVEIYYRIEVPEDPGLTGSYWSMMMVEPVPETGEPALPKDRPALGVKMVTRHGIQISVTIPETGEKKVEPRGELVQEEEGTVLELEIANPGDILVRPSVWAEVFDDEGKMAGRLTSEPQRIFPGCSVLHRFALDFPPGRYQALVVMENEDGEVWGTRYNLEIR